MNILTMNQNVFGSSFEDIRENSFTEEVIKNKLIVLNYAVGVYYE